MVNPPLGRQMAMWLTEDDEPVRALNVCVAFSDDPTPALPDAGGFSSLVATAITPTMVMATSAISAQSLLRTIILLVDGAGLSGVRVVIFEPPVGVEDERCRCPVRYIIPSNSSKVNAHDLIKIKQHRQVLLR